MALDPAVLKARIDLRVCELRLLAAQTAVSWAQRPRLRTAPPATAAALMMQPTTTPTRSRLGCGSGTHADVPGRVRSMSISGHSGASLVELLTLARCCALTASGHTPAPPSVAKNLRRPM